MFAKLSRVSLLAAVLAAAGLLMTVHTTPAEAQELPAGVETALASGDAAAINAAIATAKASMTPAQKAAFAKSLASRSAALVVDNPALAATLSSGAVDMAAEVAADPDASEAALVGAAEATQSAIATLTSPAVVAAAPQVVNAAVNKASAVASNPRVVAAAPQIAADIRQATAGVDEPEDTGDTGDEDEDEDEDEDADEEDSALQTDPELSGNGE